MLDFYTVPLISIHASRVGSDPTTWAIPLPHPDFNPRSPCGERRLGLKALRSRFIFQSTLPVGGATSPYRASYLSHGLFQSTLPVGGATGRRDEDSRIQKISIHAPRGGSDFVDEIRLLENELFQSTLPVGGATLCAIVISPLEGDFNPRSPWGERQNPQKGDHTKCYFNPRSPWGERRSSELR